jgi:hypothetical protein
MSGLYNMTATKGNGAMMVNAGVATMMSVTAVYTLL